MLPILVISLAQIVQANNFKDVFHVEERAKFTIESIDKK